MCERYGLSNKIIHLVEFSLLLAGFELLLSSPTTLGMREDTQMCERYSLGNKVIHLVEFYLLLTVFKLGSSCSTPS